MKDDIQDSDYMSHYRKKTLKASQLDMYSEDFAKTDSKFGRKMTLQNKQSQMNDSEFESYLEKGPRI